MINNFSDYGFTADFEGTIKFDCNGILVGVVSEHLVWWTKEGNCFSVINGLRRYAFDLEKIPDPWYEDEANFPALMTNGSKFRIASNTMFLLEDRERLATKEEVESLYYEDKVND